MARMDIMIDLYSPVAQLQEVQRRFRDQQYKAVARQNQMAFRIELNAAIARAKEARREQAQQWQRLLRQQLEALWRDQTQQRQLVEALSREMGQETTEELKARLV